MAVDEHPRDLFSGDRRALARAISTIENDGPERPELLRQVQGRASQALVVGLTGPPGAGKSTLIDRLITEYRHAGRRVAVIAVNPSSPFTGGAVLGDRIRMQTHASDADVFVRSMATRGAFGGITKATADTIAIVSAAGFDVVIVETVGVGQGEVDVARLADVTVVLAVPGAGDDVQALKSGLMEIADIFVVNKSDREGADGVVAAIEESISITERLPGLWRPPVLRVSAAKGAGVADLVSAIERCRAVPDRIEEKRRRRSLAGDVSSGRTAVGRIDHVGIATDDDGASRHFFESILGFEASAGEEVASDQVHVCFLGTGETRIELVTPTSETSAVAGFIHKRGSGLHHVAVMVEDLEKTLAELKSKGVRLIDEMPRAGAHGRRVAFVHPASAHGVLVELIDAGSGH